MSIITNFEAVIALVGGGVSENANGIHYHDGQTPPSESAINAKLAELQAAYNAQEYARSRKEEYPSIEDCIHAILDNELDALQAKRQLIKAKYPKPE